MSTEAVCRVCLVANMNLYNVRNDLQNVYERIVSEKFNKVGYPVHMCYICLTVLRKCHEFIETAQDANNVLKQWYNQQNEMRVTRPLYTYTISKAELVSIYNENMTSQNDIKVEKVKSEQEEVQAEHAAYNIDVDVENRDLDKQTDYRELFVDSPNDFIYTETIEDNNDRQTDPLFDCNEDSEDKSSLAPNLDDHTNIEKTCKIISPHDNDFPPIKKRKTNKTKPQHQASKSSGETATTSETSNDITPVNSTASQHRNTETKLTFLKPIKIRNGNNALPKNTIKHKSSLKILTQHVSHTGKKQFCCDNCSYKSARKVNLKTHNMLTHSGEKRFSCDICDYLFAQKAHLKRHMLTHSCEKPFSCEMFDYKCARKGSLKRHTKTHSGEKRFSCDICEYKFAQKSHLKSHMLTHSGEKPFSCEMCDYKFARKGNLKSHMLTHSGEKPFSCEIFEYKSARKLHSKAHNMLTHSGEKQFSCDICEYKFALKAHLKRHMLTHSGEKQFSCKMCDYKCAQKGNLKYHMKTHSGEKPFSCDICEYKFAQKSNLKSHMLTHSGKKPFSCEMCDYKCARKGNLKYHMKTHFGEKPFSCDICSYKSNLKGSLVKHMTTHTAKKLFSCDICDYKFSRNDSFKRHLLTKHLN